VPLELDDPGPDISHTHFCVVPDLVHVHEYAGSSPYPHESPSA
jgi:hypothetical protein